jgi:hypothetical protein
MKVGIVQKEEPKRKVKAERFWYERVKKERGERENE